MDCDFSDLRKKWSHRDYEEFRDFYFTQPELLKLCDIEELTLLEFCSYEYQYYKVSKGESEFQINQQEESFRSRIRLQRRSKLKELIISIREKNGSIYEIVNPVNRDNHSLLYFILRLGSRYKKTVALKTIAQNRHDLRLFDEILSDMENTFKEYSLQMQNVVMPKVGKFEDEEIESAVKNALVYFSEALHNIDKKAKEHIVKGLFYDNTSGYGNVSDIIVAIYEGKQEYPIARCKNCGWDEIIVMAKEAAFSKLNRLDDIDKYGVKVYIDDYPGSKSVCETEGSYSGDSIGLAIAVSFLAYFDNQIVRPEIAFTGKIASETYLIDKVGGFCGNGKAYAASWRGINSIIVPKANVTEAEMEINEARKDGSLTPTIIKGINTISEVADIILQSEKDPERYAETLFVESERLRLKDRDYIQAEKLLKELVIFSKERFSRYSTLLRYIPESLYRLGNICLHFGNIKQARIYYDMADKEYNGRAQGHVNTDDLGNFHNSYGTYYLDVYSFDKALELIDKSIEEKMLVYKEYNLKWVGSYNQKGQAYTFNCEFEKAEESLVESLRIAESNHDAGITEANRTRNYLGMLYTKWAYMAGVLDKFEVALKYFDTVIKNGGVWDKVFSLLGMAKLYYYWGCKTDYRDRYIDSINCADQGLELYASLISVADKGLYPKGLMLKFKGCSYRELMEFDKGIKHLKASHEFLEGLDSRNIDVIASTTRMELAKLYIKVGNIDGVKEEIEKAIENIKAFDIGSAKFYFADTVSELEHASLKLDQFDKEMAFMLIQNAVNKIPY